MSATDTREDSMMFPGSGAPWVSVPVTNNRAGTQHFYQHAFPQPYRNILQSPYAIIPNGSFVNNTTVPVPQVSRVRPAHPGLGAVLIPPGIPHQNASFSQNADLSFAAPYTSLIPELTENKTASPVKPGVVDNEIIPQVQTDSDDEAYLQIKTEVEDDISEQEYSSVSEPHTVDPSKEDVVNYWILKKQERTRRILITDESKVMVCSFCDTSFNGIDALQEHLPTHNDVNCKENKQYKEKDQYITDQRHPFSCTVCACKFPCASDLRIHLFCHSGKVATCEFCSRAFTLRKYLRSHMLKYKNLRIKCDICKKEFRSKQILPLHITRLHSGKPKTFKCESCSKLFVRENQFILHTDRCQRLLCHYCGEFYLNTAFIDHLKLHLKNSFPCETCNEILPTRKSLRIHEMKHKGLLPRTCDQCGLECIGAAALKKHVDSHNGVKNHACTVCGKRYSTATSLADHMNMHSGARPYKCSLCTRTFLNMRNKTRHEKLHEKGFQRIRKDSTKKNKSVMKNCLKMSEVN